MLVPSSNTVLEPESAKLLPADGSVTMHVSRLSVVTITAEDGSLNQFDADKVMGAATLLADAKVDLILWNGTAASWLGFEWDTRIVAAVEERTGIPATTAVMAINRQLMDLGATRIGLVTPYVEELEARIVANYTRAGYSVVAADRLDLTVNTDYAAVLPTRIATMVRKVAVARPEAIVIMCTNLAGASVAPSLSRELGIPVIDSVRAAVEHSLKLLV